MPSAKGSPYMQLRDDFPGLTTEGGIAFTEGGYASRGARAARGAWFRDSEGNLLGLVQFVP